MKYLCLLLAIALGYGGYTYWSKVQPLVDQVRARVAVATGNAPAKQKQASATDLLPIPNQPAAPAAAASAVAPVNVAESQRQAIARYPALSVANSEMNSRFVFRYKLMMKEKSPRLQNPAWPLQLADECAAAIADSKPKPKSAPATKPRQTGSLASAGQPAER